MLQRFMIWITSGMFHSKKDSKTETYRLNRILCLMPKIENNIQVDREKQSYSGRVTMDDIHGLFITQVLPKTIRSKNKERIILMQRMGNNRRSGRQERHVKWFRKSEFCIYGFSVVLCMFQINITYRSRNLHQREPWNPIRKEICKTRIW